MSPRILVPVAGVEPARVFGPTDFESVASASSATPAKLLQYYITYSFKNQYINRAVYNLTAPNNLKINQNIPCASIASATLRKPAMFPPATRSYPRPYSSAALAEEETMFSIIR